MDGTKSEPTLMSLSQQWHSLGLTKHDDVSSQICTSAADAICPLCRSCIAEIQLSASLRRVFPSGSYMTIPYKPPILKYRSLFYVSSAGQVS